jgi:hypothetical protein
MKLSSSDANEVIRQVYAQTMVLRKPLVGIISGYHELPYILVAPDDENPSASVQIDGQVHVSPKFVISPAMLGDTFGEVFDPETFDKNIEGRLFSFAYARKKNFKLENKRFEVRNYQEAAQDHLNRIHDELLRQENVATALIFGPRFDYYPVSIDRFVNDIVEREFRV